jgi:hypothetical protein
MRRRPIREWSTHHRERTKETKRAAVQKKVAYVGNSSQPGTPTARLPRGNDAVHQYLKEALIHLAVLPAPLNRLPILE